MSFVIALAAIVYVVCAIWIFFGTRKPGEVNVMMTALLAIFWPVFTVVWFIQRKP
jgi:hypothetical protein